MFCIFSTALIVSQTEMFKTIHILVPILEMSKLYNEKPNLIWNTLYYDKRVKKKKLIAPGH